MTVAMRDEGALERDSISKGNLISLTDKGHNNRSESFMVHSHMACE